MVKKLLLFGLFLFLVWCNNNWRLTSDGWKINNSQNLIDLTNWNKESIKRNFKLNIARQNNNEYNQVKDISKSKDSFSVLKEELDKEFSHIYSPNDSNHYENSCYLLLDVDYKDKQFVLYRNKWAGVGSWWCKLDWVERIWVMWIHNQKPDPEGEYILKSYDKETGLFKYVMSKKYWNLWDWENEYEFRFYLKNGKVIKEKVSKNINLNEFSKIWIVKIIKEKCWVENFDVDKIPTDELKEIYLTCNGDDAFLIYTWNDEYVLKVDSAWEWPFRMIIKDGKIIKEWYYICWKWFNTLEEFYNLTWELAIWDIWNNNCKFINITSWFKESWYYVWWTFVTIDNKNNIKNIWCSVFKINGSDYIIENINWAYAILSKVSDENKSTKRIKVKIKKYWNKFLLFNWDEVITIGHNPECDAEWMMFYKTFLNWKEVE